MKVNRIKNNCPQALKQHSKRRPKYTTDAIIIVYIALWAFVGFYNSCALLKLSLSAHAVKLI